MTLRPLTPNDTEAASTLAARAFHDDPLFTTLHPDEATRDHEFAVEHAAYIQRIYLPIGIPEAADVKGQLAGIALWLPPNGLGSLRWRELACLPTLFGAVGLRRGWAIVREYQAFDRAFPASGRFHYLGLLAVDPAFQGGGVGTALLRAGLDRADAEGADAYLETGTEANVAFYERHGFEVAGRIELPTAPTHWAMRRQAASVPRP